MRLEQLEDRTLLSGATADNSQLLQAYGQLPLSFEANQGQTVSQVNFLTRGKGYSLFLTPDQAVLELQKPASPATGGETPTQSAATEVLSMQLVGANAAPTVVGLDEQAGVSNYLVGNDPSQWITNVAHYGRVEYQNLYRGINLVYYGNSQTQLEYDFDVTPGASPAAIQLAFQGAQGMAVDGQGNLVLHTAGGDVVEKAPVAYQVIDGVRQSVSVHYVLETNGQVGFAVGAYDPTQELIIDPALSYSTYLGGSGADSGAGIAVDSAGNAYITGTTASTNFPTTAGAFQTTLAGSSNVFVTKLNASGTALVYSTYLGGSGTDNGSGIAVDSAGDAYVTGWTNSANFATTPGAFQTTYAGSAGYNNAFVSELNPSGSALVYSTYLGGSGSGPGGDLSLGIAVDSAGNAYVTGRAQSTNFPTTAGAFETTFTGDANSFATELNATGTALVYSTYLSGCNSNGIAVDSAGNAYVAGYTDFSEDATFTTTAGAFQTTPPGDSPAFVTKLNASGSALVYSTYLGSSNNSTVCTAIGIAVDNAGDAYVAGGASGVGYPTTTGAFQTAFSSGAVSNAIVTELNPSGSALVYSTYLGGNGNDAGYAIAVDSAGNAYVTGNTTSTNFPTTSGAFQTTLGGSQDAFVTALNAYGGSLLYSTYLGGSGSDSGRGIALDSSGNAYVTGATSSTNFPTTSGAFQTTLGGSKCLHAKPKVHQAAVAGGYTEPSI